MFNTTVRIIMPHASYDQMMERLSSITNIADSVLVGSEYVGGSHYDDGVDRVIIMFGSCEKDKATVVKLHRAAVDGINVDKVETI